MKPSYLFSVYLLVAVSFVISTCVCAFAQPASASAGGYVLGPDDQIIIRGIEGFDISDKPTLIGANGNITLPLVGHVKAGGFTVEQLEAVLTEKFTMYIQQPQISVTVVEFRSQPVSIIGAVTTPGVVYLHGRKTLYEVLSMAGGPRDTAGSTVTVTRLSENGAIPLPGAALDTTRTHTAVEIDIKQVISGMGPAANLEVKPHDVITVAQANASIVYVVGDVERAGAFTLGPQGTLSVLSAISMAGGLGRTAKPQTAKIFRIVPGESKHQEVAVNISQILAGKAEDIGLRPSDVLVVPTSSRKTFTTYMVPATIASAVAAAVYAFH